MFGSLILFPICMTMLFVLWERDARITAQRKEKKDEINAEKRC